MHSASNWLLVAVFNETQDFSDYPILFSKPQFLNALKKITDSVAIYWKIAKVDDFLENRFFFWKPISSFFKKTKTWKFWEILLIQLHSTANMLPLSFFLEIGFFLSRDPSIFLKKITNFSNVLRILTFSVALWCKFATFSDFRKNQEFFRKTNFFFKKKPSFESFEKPY